MRQDLLAALAQIQNHPACVNQDIMTFTALMTDDEVRQHIETNMRSVIRWGERHPLKKPRRTGKRIKVGGIE